MTSLVTTSFPNSDSNPVINYEEMFDEQELIYENLDRKIDYYYALPLSAISQNIRKKCIDAFNDRGRFNMKFASEAYRLTYVFESETDICTEYIELSKTLNKELSLIVENLENAIKNECPI